MKRSERSDAEIQLSKQVVQTFLSAQVEVDFRQERFVLGYCATAVLSCDRWAPRSVEFGFSQKRLPARTKREFGTTLVATAQRAGKSVTAATQRANNSLKPSPLRGLDVGSL